MLTIKDLAVSKSLDSKEMAAVRGGSVFQSAKGGDQYLFADSNGTISPVTQVAIGGPVVNTATETNLNFLGKQFVM
jgi:hypothetical protein